HLNAVPSVSRKVRRQDTNGYHFDFMKRDTGVTQRIERLFPAHPGALAWAIAVATSRERATLIEARPVIARLPQHRSFHAGRSPRRLLRIHGVVEADHVVGRDFLKRVARL